MICPVCDSETDRLFEKDGYWVHRCPACGHQMAELSSTKGHVESVYGDDYFRGGGAGYPDYLSEARLLREHGRRYARLLGRYMKPGRLLDVGCAAGFVLRGFLDEGWDGEGVEPNAAMADYARSRLGLAVTTGSLESLPAGEPFDVVGLVQVLAHFVDVKSALAQAAALTRPGGWWLVETWDRTSLAARLLGRRWHEYSPPSVLHWFNPQGLRRLAAQHGFVEVARGRPRKRLDGAHLKSLVRHHLGAHAYLRMVESVIPNRMVIPYPFTDVFWALFRRAVAA